MIGSNFNEISGRNETNANNSVFSSKLMSNSIDQQPTAFRRMTSTSSESGDSGVDPSYRQERKIFVGGIPSSVGPEQLAQFFQSNGQVEEAFIIYDRVTGRHRGFGFVTFADMNVTKSVCSTRVFSLHGRKIECKRALKREDILNNHDIRSNQLKSFRPNHADRCLSSHSLVNHSTQPSGLSNLSTSCLSYGQQRHSSIGMMNPSSQVMVNHPTVTSLYNPFVNPHQQYTIVSLPTYAWNDVYQQAAMLPSPFIQEFMIPGGSATMTLPTMIQL